MTVSIPLVAILGVIVYIAWRYMRLQIWQAVVCLLFGFLLAATAAAPEIHTLITGLVQWLTKP
jgi:ABC-type phosphate transport system auxiliary subunit